MLRRLRLLSPILLAAALLSQSTPVSAQTIDPCAAWRIEVCEEALPISSNYGDPGCEDDCYRLHYYFYLVKVGAQNDLQNAHPFDFRQLYVYGTLTPAAWQLGISGPGLSEVNVKETIACAPAYPGLNIPNDPTSPVFGYDAHSNMFAYQVSAPSPQPWDVYGRMPLFTLSVDAFPGESVDLSSLAYTFELWDDENFVGLCSDNLQTCSTFVFKTMPQPTTACTTATAQPYLRLGAAVDAPATGFPMRKKMPVWMAINPVNGSVEWEEIDFLLTINPQTGTNGVNGRLVPWVEGGLIPAASVQGFALQNKYRLYAHHIGNIEIQGNGTNAADAHNTLFYIVFDGPELESECAGVDVGFADRGRMDGGDFDCCKPTLTGDSEAVWDAQDCVKQRCTDIVLRAVPNTTYQAGSDCSGLLAFDLFATSTASTTIHLSDVRCAIKVKKTGTFTLDASETNSLFCSPAACITVTDVDDSYLRVEYAVEDATGLSLYTNDPDVLLATIVLSTEDEGCIEAMFFLDAVVLETGSSNPCLTLHQSGFSADTPSDDLCSVGGMLEISAETASGEPIEYWDYYVNYLNDDYETCRYHGTSEGGTTSLCACVLEEKEQNVLLHKDNEPLNGVSTYDMALIQRHILGIEPLSGFKQLAGDVNMSGSVTTLDLLELRKLILGIYTDLPASNSWRFIDKDIKTAILASSNPFMEIHHTWNAGENGAGTEYGDINTRYERFADEEFDEFAVPPMTGLDSKAEFVGFKVGDVNGNALPGSFQSENALDRAALQPLVLGTHTQTGRTGQSIEVPVFGLEQQSLLGWQAALGFDTALVRVTGVRWGFDIPDDATLSRGWNLAAPGELRLLWFGGADTYTLEPGRPLFFVQAELLRPMRTAASPLHLHPNSIPSEAYGDDHQHFALHLQASDMVLLPALRLSDAEPPPFYHLSAYPNPTATVFRIQIEASAPCAARLNIADALGRSVFDRALDLLAGLTALPSAQLPALAPGTYLVSLHTPAGVETLRLVRQ